MGSSSTGWRHIIVGKCWCGVCIIRDSSQNQWSMCGLRWCNNSFNWPFSRKYAGSLDNYCWYSFLKTGSSCASGRKCSSEAVLSRLVTLKQAWTLQKLMIADDFSWLFIILNWLTTELLFVNMESEDTPSETLIMLKCLVSECHLDTNQPHLIRSRSSLLRACDGCLLCKAWTSLK